MVEFNAKEVGRYTDEMIWSSFLQHLTFKLNTAASLARYSVSFKVSLYRDNEYVVTFNNSMFDNPVFFKWFDTAELMLEKHFTDRGYTVTKESKDKDFVYVIRFNNTALWTEADHLKAFADNVGETGKVLDNFIDLMVFFITEHAAKKGLRRYSINKGDFANSILIRGIQVLKDKGFQVDDNGDYYNIRW